MLDAHTHRPKRSPGLIEIESPDVRLVCRGNWQPTGPFVLGLHPWWIEQVNEPLETMVSWMEHPECLGVGETGIDKSIATSLETQISWFLKHLDLAKAHKKSLVVLHIVRSWSELKPILRNSKFEGQILLHDCQASAGDMKWLEKDERLWFSYGSALKKKTSRGFQGFLEAPAGRVLFETDDSGEDIETLVNRGLGFRPEVLYAENSSRFLKAVGYPRVAGR
ncbi:MAG: TatD family hydrolase [Pseudomonadota bacterium]